MAENSVQKTLAKLLEVVEVDLKIPLGIAEIKLHVSPIAKKWLKSEKSKSDLRRAIQHAEQNFIADHPSQKVAKILDEFPMYADKDFQKVITTLLTHLQEEEITWLAEIKIKNIPDTHFSTDEVQNALKLYLPYLRHELNKIEEFREVISASTLERIDKRTQQTDKTTERIDERTERIEKLLEVSTKIYSETQNLKTGWFFGHQYGDLKIFSGRKAEQKMLSVWLENKTENLLILHALGGVGKSALTWEWLKNKVDIKNWNRGVWWSFYEKESGFESFLSETLTYFRMQTKERSTRQQVNDLLDVMHENKFLIVLDGFERLLRQYSSMNAVYQAEEDQVDPSQRDCTSTAAETFLLGLSDKTIQSKVLLTTRLIPRILEGNDGKLYKGCHEEPLASFNSEDAIEYFHAEGITGARAEIETTCAAYGYHPLSLSLLASLINEDHEHPGDILAAKQYEIFGDIKAKRNHILQRAYDSLKPEHKELLGNLSCFRGSIEFLTIKTIFWNINLGSSLKDLSHRGLLQYIKEKDRYDIHPLVRRYTYDRLTEINKTAAHERLVDYFETLPQPKKVETLDDLAPVIELYHHKARAGKLDEARAIYYERIQKVLFFQFGAYQTQIELLLVLFPNGEHELPKLSKNDAQAGTINDLATAYSFSGQPRRAIPLFLRNAEYDEKHERKEHLAIGLGNIANMSQLPIGALRDAQHNMRRSINLCHEINNKHQEAASHREFGRILFYRGELQDAELELEIASKLFKKGNNVQSLGTTWSYIALQHFLMAREAVKSNSSLVISNLQAAVENAKRALEIAREREKIKKPNVRDFVRAYWQLGAAYRAGSDFPQAETHLDEALRRCRAINLVEMEADILLELAKLRYMQGETPEALRLVREALIITERSEYVLQGADVHLFLADLALEGQKLESDKAMNDKECALMHAQKARRLATGWEMIDGKQVYDETGEYVYKVAYDEAGRLIEKLKDEG